MRRERVFYLLFYTVAIISFWASTCIAYTNTDFYSDCTISSGNYDFCFAHNNAHITMSDGSAILFDMYNTSSMNFTRGSIQYLRGFDHGTVTVDGGYVSGYVQGNGSSNITVKSGTVADMQIYESATATINGGQINSFYTESTSTVTINGGTFSGNQGDVSCYNGTLDINGGTNIPVWGNSNGIINLRGGQIESLMADRSSVINIYGNGFVYTPSNQLLTGRWADNNAFSIRLVDNFSTTYNHLVFYQVPEPTTFLLLCLGGLFLSKKR
jgi:hypothetical protein